MLKRGEFYPLGDRLTLAESRRFGLSMASDLTIQASMRGRWTGEQRPPRAGEWYLSGALIEAYRAPSDLSAPYPIAELVKIRVETRVVEDSE